MKTFISWSGGKDTALACYRMMKNENKEIAHLLNMISENGTHSRSHGLEVKLLQSQAKSMGIPITQIKATWESYEDEFKKALADFKNNDINEGVFGDIDLQPHRDWVERVCKESRITPFLPLWNDNREDLLNEFIDVGFKAIVVAVNRDYLGEEWLGREINNDFINDLKNLSNVDLCGENGEYHTFVYDGPFFQEPVTFSAGEKISQEKHYFLELSCEE